MSMGSVVTRGYGTFGSISLIVVAGYFMSPDVPNAPGLEFTIPASLMHYTARVNRMHATMPHNLPHYTLDEDNLPHYTLPATLPHFTIRDEDD